MPLLTREEGVLKVPQAISDPAPVRLQPALPTRLLPLSLPFVVLAATSALWFTDPNQALTQEFAEELRLMNHLLVLYESPGPSSWRSHRPDSILPFAAPPTPLDRFNTCARRRWPQPRDPSEAKFSSSPPKGGKWLRTARTAAHGQGLYILDNRNEERRLRSEADQLVNQLVDGLSGGSELSQFCAGAFAAVRTVLS